MKKFNQESDNDVIFKYVGNISYNLASSFYSKKLIECELRAFESGHLLRIRQ